MHASPPWCASRPAARIAALVVFWALIAPLPALAQDLEAEAWPEFDIWINADGQGKNRIYILNSYASVPDAQYEETALGASWDRRFHRDWSWRAGVRYIWKAVDPPDKNELRVVLDLKWFRPLGRGWLLSDRNRMDLRRFSGESTASFRYRNRVQVEKPFAVFSRTLVAFASYELYYDSRFNKWAQRQRLIAGVSVPIADWLSIDVFPGYHYESMPRSESALALGVAVGIYFR